MKKANNILTRLFLFSLFGSLFCLAKPLSAQPGICQLACNDTLQLALGDNCLTEILLDDILEGSLDPDCLGPFQVNLFDALGNPIPTSPSVDDTYEGQYITAELVDLNSTNFCAATFLITDQLPAALECRSTQFDCGTDPAPTFPLSFASAASFSVLDGCQDVLINLNPTENLVDLNVELAISHNTLSELSASLTSPAGTSIDLFDDQGNLSNCGNANLSLTFDAEAQATYADFENTCLGNPAIEGHFQSLQSLATFYGESPAGDWTFTLCNTSTTNTATLESLQLLWNTSTPIIPFPVPASTDISQTANQQINSTFTLSNYDNCTDATLTYVDDVETLACSDPIAEIIYRTWTIEDAYGNTSTCIDTLSFLRLPAGSIVFPPNFDDQDQAALLCDDQSPDPGAGLLPEIGWNTLPNGFPSPFDEYYAAPNDNIIKWYGTGVPEAEGCEAINYQYSDVRIESCSSGASSACYKIVRTWTISETCSGKNYTHIQTIKVADKTAPSISGIADLTISTSSNSCTANWEAPIPQLSDNCNPLADLTYTVHATAGQVIFNTTTNRYEIENIPRGIHTVTYTAADCCNNSNSIDIRLTVADLVPPSATCVSFITSSLTADGTVRILPNSFDDLSDDNCGLLYYKLIRMEDLLGTDDGSNSNQSATNCDLENGDDSATRSGNQIWFDDYVAFCCEDLDLGNQMVVLRVFDIDPGTGPVNPSRMRPGGDLDGHFNDCMTAVAIEDKLGPLVFCPDDVTLECTENFTDLNLTGIATGYDNCELDTIFYTDAENLNECNVGTVARIWTARDATGRTATCLQTITLEDNTDPIITFPPSPILVECGEEFDLSITGMPEVSDNCSLLGINRSDEFHFFADSCLKKIIRRWTVMDFCSPNMYTSVQVIKIEDTTPPTFTGVPGDLTVDCDNIPPATAPVFDDNCDVALEIIFTENSSPGPCTAERVITRSWTAIDNCQNSSEITQEITVVDNTPPVISGIPADLSLECDQSAPPVNPTVNDNCDPAVDLQLDETMFPGSCANNFTLQRTWTATDDCGNTSQEVQLVTFEDTTLPTFTFIPSDTIISCEEAIPTDNALASDNCDPNVAIQVDLQTTPGSCPAESLIVRTWTAIDACGNSISATQSISVVDTIAPVLSNLPGDVVLECDDSLPTDAPIAMDVCDPMVTPVLVETRIDSGCEDKYVLNRTWTATDACGNSANHTQWIFVSDTTAPVFTNIPTDLTLECDGMPMDITPEATDNCDAMVMVTFMEDTAPDCLGNATLTRTWMASDNCGNTAVATQQITFTDSTPPQILGVPDDVTVECDAVPMVAVVTAMDACDPMVDPVFMENRTNGDCTDRYTLTRTWEATDDCGNVATASQVITVVDTTPPTFDTTPVDVTLACTDATDPAAGGDLAAPQVSDNCDLQVDLVFLDEQTPGACIDERTIVRTWTATDNCGNTAVRTQSISIVDEIAPVLNGIPADVTVLCDAIPDAPDNITASDNCDMSVDITLEESTIDQICTDAYTLIRRWIAVDNCGNQDIDTQRIVVVDTLAPLLLGVPSDTTVLCSAVPEPPVIGVGITATDNCDAMVSITLSLDTTDIICTDEFTLIRRWTAVDNCGNVTVDSQRLMLIDTIPPSLLNIPADLTVTCDRLADTTTTMSVSATDNCDTDVDVVFTENEDGQCPNTYIIFRRWTATDNCGNVTTKQQFIQVLDTVAPVIACPLHTDTIIIDTDIAFFTPRCDTLLDISVSAVDNCTNDITYTNDSPFAFDNDGPDASGRYPIGHHEITFTAEDRCGNISTCLYVFDILDGVTPSVACGGQPVTFILDPVTGTVDITPFAILDTLADCSIDTILFFSPEVTDTLTLTCDDLGMLSIFVSVTDTFGNSSVCGSPFVTIELPASNPNICDQPPLSYILGNLSAESGMPLMGVEVNLEGGMTEQTHTVESGYFAFKDLPFDYNYTVKPENDLDARDGVSTLDVILISRHLLGLRPLESPYQLIAADTDNSGAINTFDIIELQKLILYLQDDFSYNSSWRFVDANYTFADPLDPFSSPFPEICALNGLGYGERDVNFIGVKIGDLNGSATGNASAASSDRSQTEPLILSTEDQSLVEGQDYQIDFTAADFKDCIGFQFTLDFDPAMLELEATKSGVVAAGLQFGSSFSGDGLLTCNWFAEEGQTWTEEEILFSLHFRALADGSLRKALTINSTLTAAEAYTANFDRHETQLEFRGEKAAEAPVATIAAQEVFLFPNRPNPFQNQTTIAFQLPQAGQAKLSVTDLSGRVLQEVEGFYAAGYHEWTLSSGDLDASGVLYYQLISAGQVATRKMIRIKR